MEPIIAKRTPISDYHRYAHVQQRYQAWGIVAVWELTSPRAKKGVLVYEYSGPRYEYVWGSRALYGRWLRQQTEYIDHAAARVVDRIGHDRDQAHSLTRDLEDVKVL